jgi:carbonic anhydrase
MAILGACACCGDILGGQYDRRRFMQMVGGAGVAAAFPFMAFAQSSSGKYEAMLLSCIDPRTQDPIRTYMDKQGLLGKYSQFTIAGAAIGVVAPKFKRWHQAFWDNLGTSLQLHKINRVIVIDHRDCAAARIAYGDDSIATPEKETATHHRVFARFRAEMKRRHHELAVETGLMSLDGKVEILS